MIAPLTRADILAEAERFDEFADPVDAAAMVRLAGSLFAVGRRDLPLGRLLEGHVDALQIVLRFGTPDQARDAIAGAHAGRLFGVWNADRPGQPTRIADGMLSGGKAFASGAGLVTDALITVDAAGGRQLLLVDLAAAPPAIDRDWWHVTGMTRSQTHRVEWDAAPLAPGALIGAPGDYVREPWFSGGALRFAAVQAGGIAALVDGTRDALVAAGRADDPFQRARLAELHGAAQGAIDAVRRAAAGWSTDRADRTLALVSAARVAVYRAGEEAIRVATAAIGVQASFADHPMAASIRDLDTYLRQPGPDAQRLATGGAVAAGVLTPEW